MAWTRVQIEIERTTRFGMFLVSSLLIFGLLVGGGVVAWAMYLRSPAAYHQVDHVPQIEASHRVYIPSGHSRYEAWAALLGDGRIGSNDRVEFVEGDFPEVEIVRALEAPNV